MERINKDEIITLDGTDEYYVVDIVEEGNTHYLYLIDNKNEDKVMVAQEIIEGNEIFIETLDNEDKIKEILKTVVERLNIN